MLYSFDASSIIHLYDNYPMDNPNLEMLWDWFRDKMLNEDFVIPKRAFKEVIHKTPADFIEWFKVIKKIDETLEDLTMVQNIKDLLEIEEDDYHVKGVDENDLIIISVSKRIVATLVQNEKQLNLPILKKKYKIPSVCNLDEVKLENLDIAELLKRNP